MLLNLALFFCVINSTRNPMKSIGTWNMGCQQKLQAYRNHLHLFMWDTFLNCKKDLKWVRSIIGFYAIRFYLVHISSLQVPWPTAVLIGFPYNKWILIKDVTLNLIIMFDSFEWSLSFSNEGCNGIISVYWSNSGLTNNAVSGFISRRPMVFSIYCYFTAGLHPTTKWRV